MSPSPQLAPAGSSSYNSNTMSVGDGTWDTQRNTFLLPNLVGLNFNTMRYNGMGNRFRELPQYFSLIRGHGVVAAITFLVIVPSAILILRFHDRNPRLALRLHIWLQILTVLLTTVVFVLGWFAVGPKRSLTNPHHGIGLAIYILVLAQFLGGWWVHSRARGKRSLHEPLKAMLHHWLGRIISLLGIAQIPLGLTLYGSPVPLFILYALAVFVLVLAYFILTHLRERHDTRDHDSRYSYGSGSVVDERRRRSSGLGTAVKAGAAGLGFAALVSRFRRRSRERSHPEVVGSRRQSGSYVEEEKYSQYGRDPGREGGWKDRLLEIGAIGGAAAAVNRIFGRNKDRDRDSDVGEYGPPLGGATPIHDDPLIRPQQGIPPPSRRHPLNQPLSHRHSTSSVSYDSYTSEGRTDRRGHSLRDTVAGLGAFGLARNIFKKRRERKEQRRIDALRQQEIENERIARENSRRYTGDGFPNRGGRRGSLTTTNPSDSPIGIRRNDGAPPLVPAGTFPAGAAGVGTSAALSDRDRNRPHTTLGTSNPVLSGAAPIQPVVMPPIPPDPQGVLHQESSGSDAYISAGGRNHRRHRSSRDNATVTGAAGGAAALLAAEALRDRHHSASGGEASAASPPVSVKVKMHNDGRHVTLRRLPPEEAALEREARRRSRDRHGRRRRPESATSGLSGTDNGSKNRWRRTEALERQQAEDMAREQLARNTAAAAVVNPTLPVPLPPPPPGGPPRAQYAPVPFPPPPPTTQGSAVGGPPKMLRGESVGSPGTYDEGTENSADYANNRRRRRAERAQAKAREGRDGGVEYE